MYNLWGGRCSWTRPLKHWRCPSKSNMMMALTCFVCLSAQNKWNVLNVEMWDINNTCPDQGFPTLSVYVDNVNMFSPTTVMFKVWRKPCPYMKRHHLHGWIGLKVKRCGLDILIIRQCQVCLEDLSGGKGTEGVGSFFGQWGLSEKEPGLSKEIVHARLSKWKWLLPQLSYRRRVLVANIFVASTLWHKFIALTPPRGLMKDIQRVILDFFWSGSVHLPFINLWLRGDWSAPSRRLPLSDSGLHKNCCVTVSQAGAKQLVDCWEELDGWTNTCPFYNQRTWT